MTQDPQLPVSIRLAARTPAEVDTQVASSVQQCGVDLVRSAISKGGYEREDGSRVPVTYHTRFDATATSHDDIEAARRRVAHAMTPPQSDQVLGWLAELSVITARRMDDDLSEDLRAAAYTRRLSDYPADIARHALLVRRWKFFPTWAELADVCDELLDKRKRIQNALDMAEAKLRDQELRKSALPDDASKVMTPEERVASADRMKPWLDSMMANLAAQEAKRNAENDRLEREAQERRERARRALEDPEARH